MFYQKGAYVAPRRPVTHLASISRSITRRFWCINRPNKAPSRSMSFQIARGAPGPFGEGPIIGVRPVPSGEDFRTGGGQPCAAVVSGRIRPKFGGGASAFFKRLPYYIAIRRPERGISPDSDRWPTKPQNDLGGWPAENVLFGRTKKETRVLFFVFLLFFFFVFFLASPPLGKKKKKKKGVECPELFTWNCSFCPALVSENGLAQKRNLGELHLLQHCVHQSDLTRRSKPPRSPRAKRN